MMFLGRNFVPGVIYRPTLTSKKPKKNFLKKPHFPPWFLPYFVKSVLGLLNTNTLLLSQSLSSSTVSPLQKLSDDNFISARDSIYHICYSALYAIARPSVCPSVRHTGGSVKDG